MTIFETLRRLQRLPRAHRIAFLKGIQDLEKPRSIRWVELNAALKREMMMQIKKEIGSRNQRGLSNSGTVTNGGAFDYLSAECGRRGLEIPPCDCLLCAHDWETENGKTSAVIVDRTKGDASSVVR